MNIRSKYNFKTVEEFGELIYLTDVLPLRDAAVYLQRNSQVQSSIVRDPSDCAVRFRMLDANRRRQRQISSLYELSKKTVYG